MGNARKYLILALMAVPMLFSCAGGHKHDHEHDQATEALPSTGSFGEAITKDGAVPVAEIAGLINEDTPVEVKVFGTIVEVCQHTGCWLTMDLGNGETIQVNMKDHEFFVPMDAAGKMVWVEGVALRELISAELLRHYAEDAGRPQEYIDSITEDAWQYTIEAKGVIIEEAL
ncbi:MAG TPA: DUF4920 domain-containing protein [Bacteroidales bacterium]|nr:DUF4920 domain-containing protein [Bacteroidales bacterium]